MNDQDLENVGKKHSLGVATKSLDSQKREHPGLRLPWMRQGLQGWLIVGMNHYSLPHPYVPGFQEVWLYVAMTSGTRCIKAQGRDQLEVWNDLERQALNYAA